MFQKATSKLSKKYCERPELVSTLATSATIVSVSPGPELSASELLVPLQLPLLTLLKTLLSLGLGEWVGTTVVKDGKAGKEGWENLQMSLKVLLMAALSAP